LKKPSIASSDVLIANEQLYVPCGLEMTDLKVEDESTEYGACRFKLNGISIIYRAAKITPTKSWAVCYYLEEKRTRNH
jgi:hypothetical protein